MWKSAIWNCSCQRWILPFSKGGEPLRQRGIYFVLFCIRLFSDSKILYRSACCSPCSYNIGLFHEQTCKNPRAVLRLDKIYKQNKEELTHKGVKKKRINETQSWVQPCWVYPCRCQVLGATLTLKNCSAAAETIKVMEEPPAAGCSVHLDPQ